MPSSEFPKYYLKLKELLDSSFYATYSPDNIFQCHLVAAFSKSFEFNLIVNRKSNERNSSFLAPALRGICEDLITLKFLKKHQVIDKGKLLSAYMLVQVGELIEIQSKFLKKNHPSQIIFTAPNSQTVINANTDILKNELNKLGLNREKKFPSVSHMATDAGLVELYEYLYAATSEMVHFSPHNLLRSGWSKKKTPYLHKFSSVNFYKYYGLFNKFYGSYLFILFCKSFRKELSISKEAFQIVKELESELFLDSRWPEIITFEEMNVKEAESIRLVNLVRKIRSTAKEMNYSEEKTEEMIKQFLNTRKIGKSES